MNDLIIEILGNQIPKDLLNKLNRIYNKLKRNFWLGKDEECIEKAGKFVEIVTRILEYITINSFTPFEDELKVSETLRKFENLPKQDFPESIRIMIPRVLYSLYTFRSKRGGAHIKNIDPTHMDAIYITSACDWIIAELIRLYHTQDDREIQNIIESIVEKKVPLLEEFDNDIKILDPTLPVSGKVLAILYKRYPNFVSKKDIDKWVPTKLSSHISTTLRNLDDRGLIYRKDNNIKLTIKGVKYVEEKILKKITL
ncbi:MAG: hypothetical protein DRO88_12255 [Promethearchaeia archaeon]|uniref:Uncharacterized protein n=1 Tax=Desulfofervidus auxilii TaxID=1621989 RepID=A0A7C0Y2M9_DESA2|nr:MAG: hypothetical protein DRO88_12255 [Candidatus Lokiarchaeia archaeon]HDD44126.1 hypothetical protein [Candidatus Desulfofervidus auxilii]